MIVKSMLVRIGADTTEMETGLKKAQSSMKKHAQKFKDVGKKMTIAGAAITGAIGLMVKKASDAQETTSKFGTVFEDVFSKASASVDELTQNYGLSDLAAKTMLSSTGDLLTGLGLGGEAALGLSAKTQQLAVDLASFSNFAGGAEGASEALTKAMLGERESVKALGIVITEEMVKEQLLKEGKQKLTGQALLQAKAEATLAIAVSQSKNAIGDYQRTSGSLANVTRELKARFEDLVTEVGSKLIPIITNLAQTVRTVMTKVIEWVKENPKLVSVIAKVALGVGVLLAILGPLVMILPTLAAGITMVAGSFMTLIAPIAIVIAAVTTATIVFLKLKKAKDELRKADERLVEGQKSLRQKLIDMKNAAGMTGREFGQLNNKYKGNIVAMTMAIHKGKEGKKLQEALAKVSKKHKEEIDKQRESYETIIPKVEDYKVKLQEVPGIVKAMTDEINKATLSEYEYAKLTLEQKRTDREVAITEEIVEQTARQEALKLNEEAYQVAMAEIEEKAAEEKKTKREENFATYLEAKQGLVDSINQMTMGELAYSLWAIDQEYLGQLEQIEKMKISQEEKDALIRMLNEKRRLDEETAEQDHADKMTEIQANTMSALTSLYGDFIGDTLSAFEAWGTGTQSLLKGIGMAFKNLALGAIQALKDIVMQEALSAVQTLIKEKAKAIAKVITSVMSLPFPANILAVGGAITAVTMLFKKIKLFKEGGFVPEKTLAMLHPGELVLSAPDVKALASPGLSAMAPAPVYHTYVTINAKTLDDNTIRRAAEKIRAAQEEQDERYG